jgi:ABC-type thiamine transport system ATPase subunit
MRRSKRIDLETGSERHICLVKDEPFRALDAKVQQELRRLHDDVHNRQKGHLMLMVTMNDTTFRRIPPSKIPSKKRVRETVRGK